MVRAIDSGKIDWPGAPGGMIFYLIFEQATADARSLMENLRHIDLSWKLETLHQVTVALHQLHGAQIAHQDVKPSNVLSFGPLGSKLGDLGRACCMELAAPHADEAIAGDPDYAPPELLYNSVSLDWHARRLGCDLYLLGSMVVYLFTHQATTHLLVGNLPLELRPGAWGDSHRAALSFLREAFHRTVESFAEHVSNALLRDRLVDTVRQMCDPDPALHGYPTNRFGHGNQYSVEQYMSVFDRLAYDVRTGRL